MPSRRGSAWPRTCCAIGRRWACCTPDGTAGGRRRYGADDLTRVATILILKEAGLGLNTIGSLSATVDRATRHEILHPAAEELRSRIAAAQASLVLIEGGLNCEYEDVTQCPNYRRLISERAGPRSPAGESVIEAVAPTS